MEDKLDNPVYNSLSETHKAFAINYGNLKCYQRDYCLFGGFAQPEKNTSFLQNYSTLTDGFFIVGEKPEVADKLLLKTELVCNQMICRQKPAINISEEIITLGKDNSAELFQLINRVQPGYFKNKTMLLGRYYGIFKDALLVAVAGERMKMNEFVEVSAVVTHPDHTGNGYAKQLVAYAVNNILNENKTPYLHVAETNTDAIQLYKKLLFSVRRKISFWHVINQSEN